MNQHLTLLTVVLLALSFNCFKIEQNTIESKEIIPQMTHFEYNDKSIFKRNADLNKTFNSINEQSSLWQNVAWKFNATTLYEIRSVKSTLRYTDLNQKIIIQNNTVTIQGGKLDLQIIGKWNKTGHSPANGTFIAVASCDSLKFVKHIIINQGGLVDLSFKQFKNITFSFINITELVPQDSSSSDRGNILKMINHIQNVSSSKDQIQNSINSNMNIWDYQVRQNPLRVPTSQKHPAVYFGSDDRYAIPLTRTLPRYKLQKNQFSYGYTIVIDDYNKSQQGVSPSFKPLNKAIYGQYQSFISYGFYRNCLAYAIQKGWIDMSFPQRYGSDTDWNSNLFKFAIGDLYQVFPTLSTKFNDKTQMYVNCKANTQNLEVFKQKTHNNYFNVKFQTKCNLYNNNIILLNFNLGINMMIEASFYPSQYAALIFNMKGHSENVEFIEVQGFKMQNKQRAKQIISAAINKLFINRLIPHVSLSKLRGSLSFKALETSSVVYQQNMASQQEL